MKPIPLLILEGLLNHLLNQIWTNMGGKVCKLRSLPSTKPVKLIFEINGRPLQIKKVVEDINAENAILPIEISIDGKLYPVSSQEELYELINWMD